MANSRIATSSMLQGFPKSKSMLAGNSATIPPEWAFDSIATTTVGAGGTATITFSSIPSTYTHLQIRAITQTQYASADYAGAVIRFNSDSASNYATHRFYGVGTNLGYSTSTINATSIEGPFSLLTPSSSAFSPNIIEILDYKDTNKFKTVRSYGGYNNSAGAGVTGLYSGLWRSTSAISTITLTAAINTFKQYSSFALYGIK